MSDPAPETPILPEDAPEGLPEIILIELPILPPVIIIIPGKDEE